MNHNPKKDVEAALFREHMRGVQPLKKEKTISSKKNNPEVVINSTSKKLVREDTHDNLNKTLYSVEKKLKPYKPFYEGVTIHADDLPMQITSESILSYGLERLSAHHQEKITKGMIEINSRIDLHGTDRFEAQDRLNRFLDHAKAHGLRNLLVIHGKGSKHGETPILKQHLFLWLRTYSALLALHSAHAKHGGSGALYVLLRRHTKKAE